MSPKWSPKGDQKGAKPRPRKSPKPIVSLCFCSKGGPEGPQKGAQKCPQNEPKMGPKMGPKMEQKGDQNGHILGPTGAKMEQNSIIFFSFWGQIHENGTLFWKGQNGGLEHI